MGKMAENGRLEPGGNPRPYNDFEGQERGAKRTTIMSHFNFADAAPMLHVTTLRTDCKHSAEINPARRERRFETELLGDEHLGDHNRMVPTQTLFMGANSDENVVQG
jgi:hypothetical protein